MEHFLATWGYAALFLATFLSSMLIPVGSEVAMGYAGALASGMVGSSGDHLQLWAAIVVAILGEVVGSMAGYAIGRYGGRPAVDRLGKYILLSHRDLDRVEAWFKRRGDPFVFFGRFIPLLRSFVSVVAGLGEMAFGPFIIFTVIACSIWCATLISIGYALGASWHSVIKGFSYAGYIVAALFVVAIVVAVVHRWRVYHREQAAIEAGGRHVRAPSKD